MENIMYKPVIGVVMCRNRLKGHQTQTLQEKYLNAIVNAGGVPIALPHALAEPELHVGKVVEVVDGVNLTLGIAIAGSRRARRLQVAFRVALAVK